ncbi:MAG TPA: MarR family transcriptional regulator [Candidatus Limnocylindrales bacterium]|jgi:DNA-binding MarR family transcriptional regulator
MRTTIDPEIAGTRQAAARDALANLGRAVGSLRCAGSQRLVRLGISMTHFHVLTLLRHHDAMPMGKLAEILDASMSSATGIIDRMEERGLVERVRVPDDRRLVLVRPTQAGLDLIDEAELVKSDVMASAVARLSPVQLDRLTAATSDLQVAIAEYLAETPGYGPLGGCEHDHSRDDAATQRRPAHAAGAASPDPGPPGA